MKKWYVTLFDMKFKALHVPYTYKNKAYRPQRDKKPQIIYVSIHLGKEKSNMYM